VTAGRGAVDIISEISLTSYVQPCLFRTCAGSNVLQIIMSNQSQLLLATMSVKLNSSMHDVSGIIVSRASQIISQMARVC